MAERSLPGWRLRGQGIALFDRSVALVDPSFQLALPQHMHALDASEGTLGGIKRFEPQHRTRDALHGRTRGMLP
jgi:hypothetical protein